MKFSDKTKGMAFFLTLCTFVGVGGGLLVSCNDSDEPEVYDVTHKLNAPESITLIDATTSSLSFSWTEVSGAVQYGYELTDNLGKTIAGGVTSETSISISGLSLFSDYTFNVISFPAIGKGAQSAPVSLQAKTIFYSQVEDEEGIYTSYLINADGQSWTAYLNEDRSGNYKEGTFGTFTLSSFYNREAGKLVFTVNSDNTIKLLNTTGHDTNGWAMVTTGYSAPAARKVMYIDESSSVFDRDNNSLTYTAKFSNSASPKTEMFRW